MNGRPDRTGPPAAGRSPRLVSPHWVTRQLANGLRVEISTRTRTPDVALRLVVEAGAGTTAPEMSGLAMLAGGLLVEGAGGRSSKEMAEWLDEMGAAFGCLTSYDSAVLSMHTLSDQFANSRRPSYSHAVIEFSARSGWEDRPIIPTIRAVIRTNCAPANFICLTATVSSR